MGSRFDEDYDDRPAPRSTDESGGTTAVKILTIKALARRVSEGLPR